MKENEINSVRLVKIIKGHASSVRSLLLLEDKTIASCSTDKTIRIFEPNYYHCVKTITNNSVFSLCTIEDTNRPSNIIITNPYSSSILKLVSLSNKRIASISKSNKIQINYIISGNSLFLNSFHREQIVNFVFLCLKVIFRSFLRWRADRRAVKFFYSFMLRIYNTQKATI